MKTALIGYTGFIGSNLAKQFKFDDFYNSKNIQDISNKQYDLIVSAGNSGVKWIANKEPQNDKAAIEQFKKYLKTVNTKAIILISTVDVYDKTQDVNEDSIIDATKLAPYGKHRLELEQFILDNFPKVLITRLSQVVGPELKKNFFYDLMNDNRLDLVDYRTQFQWYNIENYFNDIRKAIKSNLKIINLVGIPMTAKETAKKVFNIEFNNKTDSGPLIYDIQTKHGNLLKTKNNYANTEKDVIKDLKRLANIK